MSEFVIYSKPNCAWCDKAKALAASHGFKYKEVDVSTSPDDRDWLKFQGMNTVPQIFTTNGLKIGDYETFKKYVEKLTEYFDA